MNIKAVVICLTCILSSPVFSEVIINGAGESIRLNKDHTWENLGRKTSSVVFQGSGKALLEIYFSIDEAKMYLGVAEDKFDKFTKKITQKKRLESIETTCGGIITIKYHGEHSVVIDSLPRILIENVDQRLNLSVYLNKDYNIDPNTVISPGQIIYLDWPRFSPYNWLKVDEDNITFNDVPKYRNLILKQCDWKNFKSFEISSEGSLEFSDGTRLEGHKLRDHVIIELGHLDPVLKVETTNY